MDINKIREKYNKNKTKHLYFESGHIPGLKWSQIDKHSCDTMLVNQFCHSSQNVVIHEDVEFAEWCLA